jgi:hypothetical protein
MVMCGNGLESGQESGMENRESSEAADHFVVTMLDARFPMALIRTSA